MSKKKKHGYNELLRYMHLLEKGYSACSIHQQYGINSELLKRYWASYQELGEIALRKYIRYYNNDRIKLRLKVKSPVQYRALFQSKAS